jgi:hypothetical protein
MLRLLGFPHDMELECGRSRACQGTGAGIMVSGTCMDKNIESWRDFALLAPLFWNLLKLAGLHCWVGLVFEVLDSGRLSKE